MAVALMPKLLLLVAPLLLAQVAAAGPPDHASSSADEGTGAVGTQAFYILFANQVLSPQWPRPGSLCQNGGVGPQGSECVDPLAYKNGVFVTSPQNMTKELVAKVKRDVPGSRVVGYWDFGELPILASKEVCPFCTGHVMGDLAGRNCSTTYPCGAGDFTTALNATFPAELAVRIRTWAHPQWRLVEGYPGLPAYLWTAKTAPLLANFLGNWLKSRGFDGIYLDGYVQPDHIHFGQACNIPVPKGSYTAYNKMDAPDRFPNVEHKKFGGECGLPRKGGGGTTTPCNTTLLTALCDASNGCGGFNSNGFLKIGNITRADLQRTPSAVADNATFFVRDGGPAITCEYDFDGDGVPELDTERATEYWAWRSAFVAMIRKILGPQAVVLANSAGAVSDPSLSGLTIEMESCTGGEVGIKNCASALNGQRAASVAAGREPLSVLWMTHSGSMDAAEQCAKVVALQKQYPWVQAGTDFFDGSHIVCNHSDLPVAGHS
jgi:hypothetical protein